MAHSYEQEKGYGRWRRVSHAKLWIKFGLLFIRFVSDQAVIRCFEVLCFKNKDK